MKPLSSESAWTDSVLAKTTPSSAPQAQKSTVRFPPVLSQEKYRPYLPSRSGRSVFLCRTGIAKSSRTRSSNTCSKRDKCASGRFRLGCRRKRNPIIRRSWALCAGPITSAQTSSYRSSECPIFWMIMIAWIVTTIVTAVATYRINEEEKIPRMVFPYFSSLLLFSFLGLF